MSALITAGIPKTMSSREIAELTGKQHAHVMRDIRTMMDVLKQDPNLDSVCKATTYVGANGQVYDQYELDKDTCLTLLLGYDAVARMKVVKRWQELEAGQAAHAIPRSFAEALRLAADATEKAERLQIENQQQSTALAVAQPKVEALERIVASDETLTITQAAKVLELKRAKLVEIMRRRGWIYDQNGSYVAYQKHIANGNLSYKEARYTDAETDQKVVKPYCHITQRGLARLALVVKEHLANTDPFMPAEA